MELVSEADVVDPVEQEPVAADDVVVLELEGVVLAVLEVAEPELIILRCFGSSR